MLEAIDVRRIAFVTAASPSAGPDNPERMARAFTALGWQAKRLTYESLAMTMDGVVGAEQGGAATPLAIFDLIWPLGLGAKETFLDRMQLLRTVDQARFVNAVDALVYLHGKLALMEFQPETHVSGDVDALLKVVAAGGRWVAKPIAGSFGRGVTQLDTDSSRSRAVLERLTSGARPCIVQRHVLHALTSEKRVLVAGREIIGAYAKTGGSLASGGVARPATLSADERRLMQRIAVRLNEQGARFAGVDLAYPHIFEANVANPGGLATLAALTGVDPAPAAARALEVWWKRALAERL